MKMQLNPSTEQEEIDNDSTFQYLVPPEVAFNHRELKEMIQCWEQEMRELIIVKEGAIK